PGALPVVQKPAPTRLTRAQAIAAFVEALGGKGDLARASADLIDVVGNWKGDLKSIVRGLDPALQASAEKALVAARADVITDVWNTIKDKFPNVRFENAGTVAFTSDIDLTMRPLQEAGASGKDMAAQIREAGEAARALADALRDRFGGRETDAVIDTNVYS